ncbi:MAG: hypothetical protein IJ822_05910, partial [Pyramidobacter sp.]|nr:hypothetical protein [Pyramidobacter sp.]
RQKKKSGYAIPLFAVPSLFLFAIFDKSALKSGAFFFQRYFRKATYMHGIFCKSHRISKALPKFYCHIAKNY